MNTQQLQSVLLRYKSTCQQFGGVCPADGIPHHVTSRPRIYIVNTDPSGYKGRHWVAFYFPLEGPCEYFDSAGKPPRLHWFKDALRQNGPEFIYNTRRIQDVRTWTCGPYCLFYALLRCCGWTLKDIVNVFDSDLRSNEHFIHNFMRRLYRQKYERRHKQKYIQKGSQSIPCRLSNTRL